MKWLRAEEAPYVVIRWKADISFPIEIFAIFFAFFSFSGQNGHKVFNTSLSKVNSKDSVFNITTEVTTAPNNKTYDRSYGF